MIHPPYNDPGPGFLGAAHAAFTPHEQGLADLTIDAGRRHRLHARADLLSQFDKLRREIDSSGMMKALDSHQQQGLDILASSKLREALDLSREDAATRELYGLGTPELIEGFNAAPRPRQIGAEPFRQSISASASPSGKASSPEALRARQTSPVPGKQALLPESPS